MEPLLTKYVREPNSFTLDFYLKHQGYDGLRKALAMKPDEIVELVKASGLRGRGGAGFPTGMKWQFVDRKSEKPRYIACNADESEPGTFKDHLLMERNPHLLIEGCAIGCFAIGAKVAYIYIRGEFLHVQHILEGAIDDAYARGFLGKNVLGSGFDCDVFVHRGAGAYEAGEETALLESLEGKRAQPRNKPPFPAVVGLYNAPTAVNNVETLCNVPLIVLNGAEWFAALGPEKNGGPKLYCISGHVKRPGVYEASMNTTLRELVVDRAGGVRDGRTLKAVIPGGSSVPIMLPDQLDTQASFDGIQKAGSLLGSAGVVVLDDTTCMVWLALNLLHFYRHESCGKCTPCREGTDWLYKILHKIERGEGQMRDLDLLSGISNNIAGKTLCAFGDAAVTPVTTTLKHFRHEYEAHIKEGRCTLPAAWRARQPVGGALTPLLIAQIVLTLFVFFMLLNSAAVMVYVERKVAAMLQQRMGPYLVGPRGLLQPLADVVKLMFKEELRPKAADAFLFALAPIISATCAFAAFAVVPFGADTTFFGLLDEPLRLQVADVNVAILVIFAVSSMSVYGIVLAGWSSNSKYSLLGGLRSSAQMISYELSYALALASVLLIGNSLSLSDIVDGQAGTWLGFVPRWFIFLQPIGFVVYMLAGIAETNRAPFDFPEAEQELVAGYHTEYSSMSFAMFFLAEYINMVTVSAVATDLFLGGWHGPFLPESLGWIWFLLKVSAILFFYVWMRWTLPRYRYDQLMAFGWKVLLPVAVLNLLLTAAGVLYFQ